MFLKHFIVRAGLLGFAFAVLSCAAASTGRLETGMTPDQAVQAMGQPDLKDAVPDPRGSGGTVVRYAWIGPGKLATFGADNRLAEIGDLPAGPPLPPRLLSRTPGLLRRVPPPIRRRRLAPRSIRSRLRSTTSSIH